ncbi:hypothetical protein [Spirillospora albida]|uniref:hypothetical protein n=1 Tax=Spirillospora albida TaxID=58123 RepID=UPI0012FC48EA|nr:hypothetical protein [Spirillospora albida]
MALKRYPEEFNADAVALYLSDPGKAYRQVAGFGDQPGDAAAVGARRPGKRHRPGRTRVGTAVSLSARRRLPDVLEERISSSRPEIRELEPERAILRKAAKYFAAETNW